MFTIPNGISLLRIFLSFLFLNSWYQNDYFSCLIIFSAIGLSDFFDGFLARYLKQESRLGKFLDPLADKIAFISCYFVLFNGDYLPNWFIIFNILKEIMFIAIGLLVFVSFKRDVSAHFASKINTCIQILLVIGILLSLSGFDCCYKYFNINLLVYLSVFLSVYSIIEYGRACFSNN